jgi:hypothetical protein
VIGERLGGGFHGDVYPVEVNGVKMAFKAVNNPKQLNDVLAGVTPKEYGGLGGGEIKTVLIGGKPRQGVLMELVEGKSVLEATEINSTGKQVKDFDAAMKRLADDGKILPDLTSNNVMVDKSGRIVVVDNAPISFEEFAVASRKAAPTITEEQIKADWQRQRETFEANRRTVRREIQQKRDPYKHDASREFVDKTSFRSESSVPTKLGKGSQSDTWLQTKTVKQPNPDRDASSWVLKLVSNKGYFRKLSPQSKVELAAENVRLINQASKWLREAGIRYVDAYGKPLEAIPLARAVRGRPGMIQKFVKGTSLKDMPEGPAKKAAMDRRDEMIRIVKTRSLRKTTGEVNPTSSPAWTIDVNDFNFIVDSAGNVFWIDPFFPPGTLGH